MERDRNLAVHDTLSNYSEDIPFSMNMMEQSLGEHIYEGIWKGIHYDGKKADPYTQNIHIVIAYCNHDIAWITEIIKSYKIRSIHVISKCGQPVENAPPGTQILILPNVGRNDHSYAHYITTILDSAMTKSKSRIDNSIVLFLKDNEKDGVWKKDFHEMIGLAASNRGFGCGLIRRKRLEFSGFSAYHDFSALSTFKMNEYEQRYHFNESSLDSTFVSHYDNMGHFLKELNVSMKNELVQVCYGGFFAASVSNIKNVDGMVWKRIEGILSRGDNIEEGHLVERMWGILLSSPLNSSQIQTLKNYADAVNEYCCKTGALVIHPKRAYRQNICYETSIELTIDAKPQSDDKAVIQRDSNHELKRIWKGIHYDKVDPKPKNIHVIVSYCSHDIAWISKMLNRHIISSLHIISICGKSVQSAPPGSTIEYIPGIQSHGHSYLYYITNVFNSTINESKTDVDEAIVVFLKDDIENAFMRSLDEMLILADSYSGFGCGYPPKNAALLDHSAYHDTSTLFGFDMLGFSSSTSFKSEFDNLGHMLSELDIKPQEKFVQVCYGNIFVASAINIKKINWMIWKRLETTLSRGVDIEENHFMERSWGAVLSTPLNSTMSESLAYYTDSVDNSDCSFKGSLQRRNQKESLSSKDRVILYLHIGRTGGTSMEIILEERREFFLSHLTHEKVHLQLGLLDPEWVKHNVTSFLFTIRNPIDRAVSSFHFEHPKNSPLESDYEHIAQMKDVFYNKCFPSLEDFSLVLEHKNKTVFAHDLLEPNNITSWDCFELGKNTLQGRGHDLVNLDLSKNYEYYAQASFFKHTEKEKFVIRAENFSHDTIALNQLLINSVVKNTAGEALSNYSDAEMKNLKGIMGSHKGEKHKDNSDLSKKGKEMFCCYLRREIEIFEELVRDAANLDAIEKTVYLDKLYQDCGISSNNVTPGVMFSWKDWASKSTLCSDQK